MSEVDVEGEHGMHLGLVVEVSSGLQAAAARVRACVCGGSASGVGEGAAAGESVLLHPGFPATFNTRSK